MRINEMRDLIAGQEAKIRRTGRTSALLKAACDFQTKNRGSRVLFIVHNQDMTGFVTRLEAYTNDAVRVVSYDQYVALTRGSDFIPFFDHTVLWRVLDVASAELEEKTKRIANLEKEVETWSEMAMNQSKGV